MNEQVTAVIPTYNNSDGALELARLLMLHFPSFHIVIVDDGSDENHWKHLLTLPQTPNVKKIRLSNNFGQHAALYAGLAHVNTTYALTMDDDHRELVPHIPSLLEAASRGNCAVIYGMFTSKRGVLRAVLTRCYRALSGLIGANHGRGSAFRLIRRDLFQPLIQGAGGVQFLDERIRWFTNEISFVPLQMSLSASTSRYSLRDLFRLGFVKSIYATDFPLRLMASIGGFMALVNLVIGTFFLYKKWIDKIEVPGYTSLIVSILFSTGLILFGLGILATYLRQILLRINQAPTFHIQEISE
ncbi:MAG: glycosyltransferase [Cryomorphaceae bacterium]|nr:glycosyltransferase [Cryomorphaceae bacterium]